MNDFTSLLIGKKGNNNFSNKLIGLSRLKDYDKDGVPNIFDCKPKNRYKDSTLITGTVSPGGYVYSGAKSIYVGDQYSGQQVYIDEYGSIVKPEPEKLISGEISVEQGKEFVKDQTPKIVEIKPKLTKEEEQKRLSEIQKKTYETYLKTGVSESKAREMTINWLKSIYGQDYASGLTDLETIEINQIEPTYQEDVIRKAKVSKLPDILQQPKLETKEDYINYLKNQKTSIPSITKLTLPYQTRGTYFYNPERGYYIEPTITKKQEKPKLDIPKIISLPANYLSSLPTKENIYEEGEVFRLVPSSKKVKETVRYNEPSLTPIGRYQKETIVSESIGQYKLEETFNQKAKQLEDKYNKIILENTKDKSISQEEINKLINKYQNEFSKELNNEANKLYKKYKGEYDIREKERVNNLINQESKEKFWQRRAGDLIRAGLYEIPIYGQALLYSDIYSSGKDIVSGESTLFRSYQERPKETLKELGASSLVFGGVGFLSGGIKSSIRQQKITEAINLAELETSFSGKLKESSLKGFKLSEKENLQVIDLINKGYEVKKVEVNLKPKEGLESITPQVKGSYIESINTNTGEIKRFTLGEIKAELKGKKVGSKNIAEAKLKLDESGISGYSNIIDLSKKEPILGIGNIVYPKSKTTISKYFEETKITGKKTIREELNTLYHGTTTQSAEKIKAEGLKPASETGIYRGISEKPNVVFVTTNKEAAEGYARRSAIKEGSKPEVLSIQFTKGELKNIIEEQGIGRLGEIKLREIKPEKIYRESEIKPKLKEEEITSSSTLTSFISKEKYKGQKLLEDIETLEFLGIKGKPTYESTGISKTSLKKTKGLKVGDEIGLLYGEKYYESSGLGISKKIIEKEKPIKNNKPWDLGTVFFSKEKPIKAKSYKETSKQILEQPKPSYVGGEGGLLSMSKIGRTRFAGEVEVISQSFVSNLARDFSRPNIFNLSFLKSGLQNNYKEKEKVRFIQPYLSSFNLKSLNETSNVLKSKENQLIKQKESFSQISNLKSNELLSFNSNQQQKTSLKQEQSLKNELSFSRNLKQPSPGIFRFDFPMEFNNKLGEEYEREGKITKGNSYDSYAYIESTKPKKSYWLKLNKKPLTKSSAVSLSARFVDQNISAKGKIIKNKSKNPIEIKDNYYEQNKYKFREFQQRKGTRTKLPNSFIEKQKYRLDNLGERKTIQKEKKLSNTIFRL